MNKIILYYIYELGFLGKLIRIQENYKIKLWPSVAAANSTAHRLHSPPHSAEHNLSVHWSSPANSIRPNIVEHRQRQPNIHSSGPRCVTIATISNPIPMSRPDFCVFANNISDDNWNDAKCRKKNQNENFKLTEALKWVTLNRSSDQRLETLEFRRMPFF